MTAALETTSPEYLAAIHTRRRLKCIAEGAHPEAEPDTPGQPKCPRCGL